MLLYFSAELKSLGLKASRRQYAWELPKQSKWLLQWKCGHLNETIINLKSMIQLFGLIKRRQSKPSICTNLYRHILHCVTRRVSLCIGLFIGEKSFKIFLSIEICFTSPSFMVQIQLNLKVPGLFGCCILREDGCSKAISRKVVGKSARDNPGRYILWMVWVNCSSKKCTYVCEC